MHGREWSMQKNYIANYGILLPVIAKLRIWLTFTDLRNLMWNFLTFSRAYVFNFTVHQCTKLFEPKVKETSERKSWKISHQILQFGKRSFRPTIQSFS